VIHTWIQLRGLAWGQDETPQLGISQLSELTGKSRSTIFGHMALLRQWGALRWRSSEEGTLIVTFPTDSGEFFLDDIDQSYQEESRYLDNPESWNSDLPDPSLNPSFNQMDDQFVNHQEQSLEEINSQDIDSDVFWEREINQLDYSQGGSPTKEEGRGFQNSGRQSNFSDSVQEFGLPPELDGADPAKVYQKVTGIRPNKYQRDQLKAFISDTNIWYSAITHWQLHGWSPKNVYGIIELYNRGGAPACRYCGKENDSNNDSLSTLNELREEYKNQYYDHP